MISIIVAVDKNNNIGKDGDMLFMLPSYIDKFIGLTDGKRVIMGRKTFDSFANKPLPNICNMIITSDEQKILLSSKKILDAMKELENKPEEETSTVHSLLADENNAVDFWYSMDTIKCFLRNEKNEVEEYDNPENEIFIIGGGEVFKELLPYCDRVYITKYEKLYLADTTFPTLDENEWDITYESDKEKYDGFNYQSFVYDRVSGGIE